jgi:hypothetical protein
MTRLTAELRLGNLVWRIHAPYGTEHDRWVERVTHLKEGEDLRLPSSYIEPIELSEEWLIKLGFVLKRLDTEDTFERYYLPIPNSNLYIANTITYQWVQLWDENHKSVGFGGCQYVHQLQNLYFSLTSLELNIKE